MADLLQVVEPAVNAAPRLGLLASIPVINRSDDELRVGIKFTPEPAGGEGGAFDLTCGATVDVSGDKSTVSHEEDFTAFGVFEPETCSTFGYAGVDVVQRAERALLADESKQVEKELWTGTLSTAAFGGQALNPNRFLARSVNGPAGFPPATTQLNGGAATGIVRALADLEWAIAQGRSGGRCMIHANRITVTYWIREQLLYRSGNLLLTYASDTIVVPGEGYDGSAPGNPPVAMNANHNSAWAYATGPIRAYRSPATTVQPASPELAAGNPGNRRTAIARSVWALEIDPSVFVGINVTHTSA